jgi:hypothetical protein
MELPAAFDRYVEGQLPKALPELKLSREDGGGSAPLALFFSASALRTAKRSAGPRRGKAGRCACTSTRDRMSPSWRGQMVRFHPADGCGCPAC